MIAIPKPLEITTTSHTEQSRPVAEQRIWLENVSWQIFEQLLEDIGDKLEAKLAWLKKPVSILSNKN